MLNQVVVGDARRIPLPDESVHLVVTSPPYWRLRRYEGLGDEQLGLEETPQLYIAHIVEVLREVRRVLRKDGCVALNLGDSYAASGGSGSQYGTKHTAGIDYDGQARKTPPMLKPKDKCLIPHRVAIALQDDGWWIRHDVPCLKLAAMPESTRDRFTTAHEYILHLTKGGKYYWDPDAIRRPLANASVVRMSQPTFDEQTGGEKDYAGGTNANRSARKALENLKGSHSFDSNPLAREQGVGGVWAGRHDGWKAMMQGRTGHGHSGYFDDDGVVRFSSFGRNFRTTDLVLDEDGEPLVYLWHPQPFPGQHFAVFPIKLAEPWVKAACPERTCPSCGAGWVRVTEKIGTFRRRWSRENAEGSPYAAQSSDQAIRESTGWQPGCGCGELDRVPGIVLDPFAGSGTVGVACALLNRQFVGLDLSPEYAEMANARIQGEGLHHTRQQPRRNDSGQPMLWLKEKHDDGRASRLGTESRTADTIPSQPGG